MTKSSVDYDSIYGQRDRLYLPNIDISVYLFGYNNYIWNNFIILKIREATEDEETWILIFCDVLKFDACCMRGTKK